jgi:hypothetical protein
LLSTGKLARLEEASQVAADKSYQDTVTKLLNGLDAVLKSYQNSSDPRRREIFQAYIASQHK